MASYDRIETDNPLLDEVVYNIKLLLKSCIIKSEYEANNYETLESRKNSDLLIACVNNRAKVYMFDYTAEDLISAGATPGSVSYYLSDYDRIPEDVATKMVSNLSSKFIKNYEEKNNYYRRLCGLPDIGDTFIYLDSSHVSKLETLSLTDFTKIPVHQLPSEIKLAIRDNGVLDDLIAKYPNKYYLKNIWKNVEPYIARTTEDYECVYADEVSANVVVANKFKEYISKNAVYIKHSLFDSAYRLYSDYYDRIMILIVIVQSACDMISRLSEYYIYKDVFDLRTCKYIFESNGMEFFPEIPLRFQIKLVQNLNSLFKYKGTEKNIIDISSLFGFKNITVYKYYLNKYRLKDKNNEFVPDNDDINMVYDLRFIKLPIDDNIDNYAKEANNYIGYDSMIANDIHWNGPYSHEYIKDKLLNKNFTVEKSKYISIDSIYSLSQASFQLSYFINMVLYSGIDFKDLTINIPMYDMSYKLTDVLVYMYALSYYYDGAEGNIITVPSDYLTIKGFNFNVNMDELALYIAEKGYTLKELGVSGFKIPDSGIMTRSQMLSIFMDNKAIYNHIIDGMRRAEDKKIYDCYKYIYDSIMLTGINTSLFYIKDLNRTAKTYKEFLQHSSADLFKKYSELLIEDNEEDRYNNIFNEIEKLAETILTWLATDELSHIFSNLPINSSKQALNYLYKIINYFKSHRIYIKEIQNIYSLDEGNYVMVIDRLLWDSNFEKGDTVAIKNKIASIISTISFKDGEPCTDNIEYEPWVNIIKQVKDNPTLLKESFIWNCLLTIDDKVKIIDKFDFYATLERYDMFLTVSDRIKSINSIYEFADSTQLTDKLQVKMGYFKKSTITDAVSISDIISISSTYE